MEDPRDRLAALAAAAGYPRALLVEIAAAALPRYRAGEQLDDAAIDEVADAVELLAHAGHDADSAHALLDHHRRHGGARWRTRLWQATLAGAETRGAQPEDQQRRPGDRPLKPRTPT